jgi:outer membrane protein TolC
LEVAKQRPDFHLGPGYQWDQGENKWSVALTFELPLFNHNQGPIAEAEARRREAAAQFFAVQAQALGEIDAAIGAQQVATDALAQVRRLQTEIARQADATERRLRAGGADQVDVLAAQLERATVDLAAIEAEAQIASSAGQLENALQVPLAKLDVLASTSRSSSSP